MSIVASVVFVGALGACGSGTPVAEPSDDVTATAEPTPTVTPTPSPEPSPTADAAPPRPAAMDRTDGEGAAAAAKYFLSLYSYSMRTGDTTEWDAMNGGSTCGFCSKVSEAATTIRLNGETFTGGRVTVTEVQALERDELVGGFPVLMHYSQGIGTSSKDGQMLWESPAESGRLVVDTLHDGTRWRILAVTQTPES